MTQERYDELFLIKIINGCGASEGGFNFSDFYRNNIKTLEEFNPNLNDELLVKIELKVCGPHDVDFHNGNTIFHFHWANIKAVYRLFMIIDWAGFLERLIPALIFLVGVTKKGKKTFNFGKKRYIKID